MLGWLAEPAVATLLLSELGHLPNEGRQTEVPPYRVTVTQMSGRRVQRLRFERIDPAPNP